MDLHKFSHITVEEAKRAHLADEHIQKKFGVKYLQFWVNECAGTIFCLIEGPDKATCEAVHRMAHGHIACAIVEVDPSYQALIMGEHVRIENGLVREEDGTVDLGYRSILALTLLGKPPAGSTNHEYLKTPVKAHDLIMKAISKSGGRVVQLTGDDSLVSVFNSAGKAVLCAREIQSGLLAYNARMTEGKYPVTFSIGIGAGEPVTENSEFIEQTIRLARRLSQVAGENKILLSFLVRELSQEDPSSLLFSKLKSLAISDEQFLTELFDILDEYLTDENLNIEFLVQKAGISRPQLYRKIRGLTGKAPNDFIRDLRLHRSLSLLRRKSGNISEIAYDVGFSNPSYFAKCFARKFNCLPSRFLAIAVD